MTTFTKIRLALGGIVLLGVMLFLGYQLAFGQGTLHVIGFAEDPVELFIDGEAMGSVGELEYREFKLDKGDHNLVVKSASGKEIVTRPFRLKNGFSDQVASVDPDQCFVVFDVTDFLFETPKVKKAGHALPGTLYERLDGTFELPASTYVTEANLPSSISETGTARVLMDGSCRHFEARTDAELIKIYRMDDTADITFD